MRYTKYTTKLPTRTTLRTTATRTRDAASEYATHAVVALAILLGSLPANPFALLAAAAAVVAAARAVPLLALCAARRTPRALDRRA